MSEIQEMVSTIEIGGRVMLASAKVVQMVSELIVAALKQMIGAEARMTRARSKSARLDLKQKKKDLKDAKLFSSANGKIDSKTLFKLSQMSQLPIREFVLDKKTYDALKKEANARGIVFADIPNFSNDGKNHVMLLENERNMKSFEDFMKSCKKNLSQAEKADFEKNNREESLGEYVENSKIDEISLEKFEEALKESFGENWKEDLPSEEVLTLNQDQIQTFMMVKENNEYQTSLRTQNHTVIQFEKKDIIPSEKEGMSRIAVEMNGEKGYVEVSDDVIKKVPVNGIAKNKKQIENCYAVFSNDQIFEMQDLKGKKLDIVTPKDLLKKNRVDGKISVKHKNGVPGLQHKTKKKVVV